MASGHGGGYGEGGRSSEFDGAVAATIHPVLLPLFGVSDADRTCIPRQTSARPTAPLRVPEFSDKYAACARTRHGVTPAELFPAPALSCGYPRTPRRRPRARRATPMKLTPPFSGFNGHAARLTLSRPSATSRPPLPAKCHGVLLLTSSGKCGRAACAANDRADCPRETSLSRTSANNCDAAALSGSCAFWQHYAPGCRSHDELV